MLCRAGFGSPKGIAGDMVIVVSLLITCVGPICCNHRMMLIFTRDFSGGESDVQALASTIGEGVRYMNDRRWFVWRPVC